MQKFDSAKVAAYFSRFPDFQEALVEFLEKERSSLKFGELDAATLSSLVDPSTKHLAVAKFMRHVEAIVLFAEVAENKDGGHVGMDNRRPWQPNPYAGCGSDVQSMVDKSDKFCALVPGIGEDTYCIAETEELDGQVVPWYSDWYNSGADRAKRVQSRPNGNRAYSWCLEASFPVEPDAFKAYVMSRLADIRAAISVTDAAKEAPVVPAAARSLPVSPKVGGVVGMERETAALHSAMVAGKPAMLVGPTGCGKTFLVRQYHKWDNERRKAEGKPELPLVIHTFHQESSPTEIVGKATLSGGDVVWQDSEFMKLFESGGTYFADEFNFAPGGAHAPLFAALNGDPEIHVPEAGKTYVRNPDFRFVAACNPASKYAGRQPVDKALASRFFVAVEFGYLKPADEKKLIVSRIPDVRTEEAEKVVSFACAMRKAEAEGRVFVPFGTRDALHVSELLVAGYPWDDAVKFGFAGKSDNEDQAAEILRVAGAELPKVSFEGDEGLKKQIDSLKADLKAARVEAASAKSSMLIAEKKLKNIKDSIGA